MADDKHGGHGGHHHHGHHKRDSIMEDMKHVSSQRGSHAKKAALFDKIHGQIEASVAASKSLGATDAQLAPFTETLKEYTAHREDIIAAVDLT